METVPEKIVVTSTQLILKVNESICVRTFVIYVSFVLDVITTDKEAIYHDAMNELVLPVEGDEVDLKITYVKNACQFYAIQDANSDESKENGLYYLLKMMNTKETVKTYKPVTIIPSIGEMVLVFYDDKWLRGKVIDYITTETDMFKVNS